MASFSILQLVRSAISVGADIEDLYYIGRLISTLAALLSLLVIFFICQRLVGDSKWSLLCIALFLAPFHLHQFASSFRPDHWLLCLSLLSCFICLRRPKGALFCLLVVLPTISYLIKAPGIIIAGCIFFSFVVDRRYKAALLYILSSAVFLIITVVFLQWSTQGLFFSAFLGGVKTSFSIRNTLSSFNYSSIWLPILMVPMIYVYLSRHSNIGEEDLRIIVAFWAVETLVALVTASRNGSNVYYFLQAYAYATFFFICWLHTKYVQFANRRALPKFDKVILFIILTVGTVFIIIPLGRYLPFPIIDDAVYITLYYGKDRHEMEDWINKNDFKCYSDDDGLNVLLKKPMVIYPYVQHLLFLSGYLDKEIFFDQIRQHRFDLIVLTDHPNWSWQGITKFPKEFFPLVHKYYKPLKTISPSRYSIYVPKLCCN